MKITLIAAIGKNNEIGHNNQLLWDLPKDMQHFRSRTAKKPVVMGRKTFESIGRPLPGRTNIVLTRNTNWAHEDVVTYDNLDSVLKHCASEGAEEVMIIGGAQIYTQALDIATNLSITHVEEDFPDADAFFPKIAWQNWQETSCQQHHSDEIHSYSFNICEYERK